VVQYDNKAKRSIPLSSDLALITNKIRKMKKSKNQDGANYFAALDFAHKELRNLQGSRNRTRVIVFLATNNDTSPNPHQLGALANTIRNAGVTIS
jgi:hypothetical protein